MNRCNQCGIELSGAFTLCPHHHLHDDPGWAATNRIMCDFVHRALEPPRLPSAGHADDVARCFDEVA
jgi:hypothetical protein